jgi:hypothetical protein
MLAVCLVGQLGQASTAPVLQPQLGQQPQQPTPVQTAAVGSLQETGLAGESAAAPQAESATEKKFAKKSHFMIISRPHSGMKWLKNMMNENSDVFCHGEPLLGKTDQEFDDFKRDFCWDHLPTQENHRRILDSASEGFSWLHSEGKMDFLASKYHNASQTISKGTLQRGVDFAKWLVNNEVKIILLTRQGMLARRVSTFGGDEDSVLKAMDQKYHVDTTALVKALQGDEELAFQTAPWLFANGIRKDNVRPVKYEDLVADPASQLGHLFEFIGATNKSNYDLHEIGRPYRKAESAKLRHTIENIVEVEEAIKGTKWAHELDQPMWRPQ